MQTAYNNNNNNNNNNNLKSRIAHEGPEGGLEV
jgi:hypothetical protein